MVDGPLGTRGDVAETQTFAQALQGAVSAFTSRLGALNTARGGVEAALEDRVIAQAQLDSALAGQASAAATEAEIAKAALLDRDEVVSILQSWAP